ncbi:MAG: hypothetical protein OEW80_05520 [Gemmatimonadota bacterium]|nr:hypothetical protein [Gemmatimonadota bacterium]
MPLPFRSARRVPLVALLLLLPTAAAAQIGGVINKGKKKAAEAVSPVPTEQNKGCTAVKFDKDVLELMSERLDRIMKGVQAARAQVGPGGKSAAQMTEQASAAFEERDKLLEGKEEQIGRYTDAEGAWSSCRGGVLDSLKRKHGAEAQQRLMGIAASQDASSLQAIVEAQTKATEAYTAGDTITANKAMAEYYKRLGFDFAKDTAEADRICKKPVKPAWLIRADSLGRLGNKLVEDAQALETSAVAKGAEVAGMGQQQFAIARERIFAFIESDGAPGSSWCYSPAEREALKARLKELKAMDFQ